MLMLGPETMGQELQLSPSPRLPRRLQQVKIATTLRYQILHDNLGTITRCDGSSTDMQNQCCAH